jgi:tRNA (guanine-N7-)-methyltransferase
LPLRGDNQGLPLHRCRLIQHRRRGSHRLSRIMRQLGCGILGHMSVPRQRRIEYELGVPLPGEILPPERWVQTALKKLPDEGPLDFAALFGREAPLILDLGCGNGRFTLASAVARPHCNHLGLDILPVVIRYATRRANQRGLAHVRFAVCGAMRFLRHYVAPHSVAEIHVYHPQPHQRGRSTGSPQGAGRDVGRGEPCDRRGNDQVPESARRLLSPEFLALIWRALVPGGLWVVQTDNRPYWQEVRRLAPALFEFRVHRGPWPDAPQGRTRREIVARRRGLKIYRATARARRDVDDAYVTRWAAEGFAD